ncbi:MAG: hypothetical protein QN141_05295 [Armatimonadota bacterium]|nr:hypothetical protein [Armatimonadota bacterium]MDR7451328.1 hypothetical protein [Armatimonadota bacterium]MDR7466768.1 hypothetical protein [Armatimonadota bacterium]MDR7492758.1 hypothetical protein [Armatimonadota bacterium]MDR7498534.1 hypothetical protein [Armatimonadota bacterium]
MNPIWHALWLTVETALWFVLIGGAVAVVVSAVQNWLHVRLFRRRVEAGGKP